MAFSQEADWLRYEAENQREHPGAGTLYNFFMSRIFPLILLLTTGVLSAADPVFPVFPGLDANVKMGAKEIRPRHEPEQPVRNFPGISHYTLDFTITA